MSLLADWGLFVAGHLARAINDILSIVLSPFLFLGYLYKQNRFFTVKKEFNTILITGGSAGIGLAIAKEFINNRKQKTNNNNNKQDNLTSKPLTIILTGRNTTRLDGAKKELETYLTGINGEIVTQQGDVTDLERMKSMILEMDDKYTIDLIIANAGVSHNVFKSPHYDVTSKAILDINCQGVLNTILPIIPRFEKRQGGHIAVVGSLSGHASGPIFSNYGASKAYIRFLCDDLRPKLKEIGNIDLTYIAPGYVATYLTNNWKKQEMPGFMTSERASKICVNGLINNYSVLMFPGWVAHVTWVLGSAHPIVNSLFGANFMKKGEAFESISSRNNDNNKQ